VNVALREPNLRLKFPHLHAGQEAIYQNLGMRNILRCGRRFGKSTFLELTFGRCAVDGQLVGWFCPSYKLVTPTFNRLVKLLGPMISRVNRVESIIETTTGGALEFWTLDNEDAGRSRFYHHAVLDEASLVKKGLKDTVEQAIMPTLLDYDGTITVAGTPKGIDPENYFYYVSQNKEELGFVEFHQPTASNPLLSRKAVSELPDKYPPLVYQQEYLAEFVDWSGDAFFSSDRLLVDGKGVAYPTKCDFVLAIIDSATKTGKENDGTSVAFYAYSEHNYDFSPPLVLLDWDLTQIEGRLLETWLPSIFRRLEELSGLCGARQGSAGAFIEDKASGMVLLQQCANNNWPATAIDSKLTAMGKVERAIDVSGYVWQNKVKFSAYAFDKNDVSYKGIMKNHMWSQVVGFRVGVKEATDDDCLDTFCYGIALTLGNRLGF
jgi:hypothetical protein